MSRTLTVKLTDDLYAEISRQASMSGTSPDQLATNVLAREFAGAAILDRRSLTKDQQAACDRFERHFGEVDLGGPTGTDNGSIDADLAREYASNHEE